tara:strand:- start:62 stop:814 length:753 start_codon:yes stop_codon:yes gene_type:complete
MNTVLENSGGPGSSITLDPEIISIRDRYLKALEGKPFDEMNLLIQKQLETESEDLKRISLLAARVYILRLRTLELRNEPTENAMPWSKPDDVSKGEQKIEDQKNTEEAEKTENEWRRLRMIEAGEVNGVRFPPGIIIDVNSVDGEKLVESKKAEYVDTSKSEDENDESSNSASEDNNDVSDVSNDAEDKTEIADVKTETESKATSEDQETTESKEPEVKADGDNLADELAELSNSITTEVENNDDKKDKK